MCIVELNCQFIVSHSSFRSRDGATDFLVGSGWNLDHDRNQRSNLFEEFSTHAKLDCRKSTSVFHTQYSFSEASAGRL